MGTTDRTSRVRGFGVLRASSWRNIHALLRYGGAALAVAGLVSAAISPLAGPGVSSRVWLVEPLLAVGLLVAIVGLVVVLLTYTTAPLMHRRAESQRSQREISTWSRLTQHYFDTFTHDLGRPLRRILGKERELRVRLEESGREIDAEVLDLLDEIEQQVPSFRLMISNIQVLIELEDDAATAHREPIEPAQIIRGVVDRYSRVGRDRSVEVVWWSEPTEFGVEYSDPGGIDHVVTNLVDNAVRHAEHTVEVRLTRNPTHFFIRVWDDGPGIPESYLPHLFDRGWTPEVAGRRERTSSGLGLYIARTLARRSGGELTVQSARQPDPEHYTAFTLMLPRAGASQDRPK